MDYPQYTVPQSTQKFWYWVTGRREGNMVLLGPYTTKDEADEYGFDGFPDGGYETHLLGTRNRAQATQMLKHVLFSETRDLNLSMKPFRHTAK